MLTEEHDREYYRAGKADEAFHDALVSEYGEHLAGDARYWPTDGYPEAIQILELEFRRACDRLNDHCRLQREEPKRRAELDAYLSDLEARGQARVIRVTDLGAALEAREAGVFAARFASWRPLGAPSVNEDGARRFATRAAHLARKALVEVSS